MASPRRLMPWRRTWGWPDRWRHTADARVVDPNFGLPGTEPAVRWVIRWLREPLVAFTVLGTAMFAVYGYVVPASVRPVVLDEGTLAILYADYEAVTGSAPDAAERERIIEDYYRREVLFREGLREGVAETSPELREVVIQIKQQRVAGIPPEPTETELANFYGDHFDRYYAEPTISLEQRFRSAAPADPEALLAALRQERDAEFDPAPTGAVMSDYGVSLLQAMFGARALARLQAMPPQQWEGPFETPQGWHYFRVLERRPRELLSFERARQQVRADYQAQIVDQRLEQFLQERRERYPLEMQVESREER